MVKSAIVGLFGRSPFKPMQKHMEIVAECAAQVVPLIAAVVADDTEAFVKARARILELEGMADDAKNAIRSNLPKSLLMPVDRRDLLDILQAQDSIADTAQDVAGIFSMRQLTVPESFDGLVQAYAARVVDAVVQCEKVINELDELLAMGFHGRQVERVSEMIDVLAAIETETDDQGMELAVRLFKLDDQMPTGTFILWHELIQKLGNLADLAENVGDRLRLLMAR
ncbi:MAG: TIGR00153 family protein [Thermoanaerobaculia bacterium]|nr:TIGR00153 family protein [Thermoanaerobaculia bacterium]